MAPGPGIEASEREPPAGHADPSDAVAKHGHTDGAELRSGLRTVLKDAEPTPA